MMTASHFNGSEVKIFRYAVTVIGYFSSLTAIGHID
jgi:hypothetical protein